MSLQVICTKYQIKLEIDKLFVKYTLDIWNIWIMEHGIYGIWNMEYFK